MKMKQISASSIQEALSIARRELGEDAVLLESKKLGKGNGVTVTFAVDSPDIALFDDDADNDNIAAIVPPAPPPLHRKPASARAKADHPLIAIISQAFEYHQLSPDFAGPLLDSLRRMRLASGRSIAQAEEALTDALTHCFRFSPIAPSVAAIPKRALMFVGPHGAGKTSAIAKFATQLTLRKQPVVIISTDMERMAGIDALQKLKPILQCDFYTAETRAALKILLKQYLGKAWVLIDSTGANIYEFSRMKALGELAGLQGIEPILVCPAGIDAEEAREMAGVFDFLSITRMLVTRLDAARRLKSIFSAALSGDYALCEFSDAPSPSEPCRAFTPTALSHLILRHMRERLPH